MVSRAVLRKVHLYLAALLLPFIFLMSLSGGLEIFGIEGDVTKVRLHVIKKSSLDFHSPTLKRDVIALFGKLGIETEITRVKIKKGVIYTRPSYAGYYAIKDKGKVIKIYQYTPDLIRRFMSLHKGNGSAFYQFYQKLMVFGLLAILLVGVWLGLGSSATRMNTSIVIGVGAGIYLLAFL